MVWFICVRNKLTHSCGEVYKKILSTSPHLGQPRAVESLEYIMLGKRKPVRSLIKSFNRDAILVKNVDNAMKRYFLILELQPNPNSLRVLELGPLKISISYSQGLKSILYKETFLVNKEIYDRGFKKAETSKRGPKRPNKKVRQEQRNIFDSAARARVFHHSDQGVILI